MEVIQGETVARLLVGEQPPDRAYLESLTTSALIKAADNLGIDIPPDLDRILIINELLEIAYSGALAVEHTAHADTTTNVNNTADSNVATTEENDSAASQQHEIEPVPLPKRYNITYIEVFVRDPFWAFVFWEIKSQDKEQLENADGFESYYLKVLPDGATSANAEGVFTVPVGVDDTGRYLGMTPISKKATAENERQFRYKVELCAGTTEGETVLAVSNPFSLPLIHEVPAGSEARRFTAENPIALLSGYEDFHVVRRAERVPRKRSPVHYE
ncbi:MAG: DUF4912 domain-containing protein [Treponema sp.]|nr:DUF4912 domain-containing protein [Treponema sp.]